MDKIEAKKHKKFENNFVWFSVDKCMGVLYSVAYSSYFFIKALEKFQPSTLKNIFIDLHKILSGKCDQFFS